MAGIYLHVPFCRSKCAYCDFYSVAGDRFMEPYAAAVAKEWEARRRELGNHIVSTIYFGGGTPSALPLHLLAGIAELFPKDNVAEFTIEVNPDDVSAEAVAAWRRMGVNRVSMGVQSLLDGELRAVGRRHSAAQAIAAVEMLKQGGISNISCDLIYGLPGQTLQSWEYSLHHLLDTGITHLSAYALSYEEGTRLTRMLDKGELEPASEELSCAMYDTLCRLSSRAGMRHYEISNFSLPGMESRHNSSYWDGATPYLGLGPGAHSLDCHGVRRLVPPGLSKYIAQPEAAAIVDVETELDRLNDLLFVALRTARGLTLATLPEARRAELMSLAAPALRAGHLVCADGRLAIPEEHWLISDAVIRDLLFEEDD